MWGQCLFVRHAALAKPCQRGLIAWSFQLSNTFTCWFKCLFFILRRFRRLMFISSLPFYVLVILVDGARFAHMSSSGQPSVLRCLITQRRSGTPADIGLNFFTVRYLRTPKFCLRNVLIWWWRQRAIVICWRMSAFRLHVFLMCVWALINRAWVFFVEGLFAPSDAQICAFKCTAYLYVHERGFWRQSNSNPLGKREVCNLDGREVGHLPKHVRRPKKFVIGCDCWSLPIWDCIRWDNKSTIWVAGLLA